MPGKDPSPTDPKILFLDIETAPHKVYVWGLFDQNISIHNIVEPGYTLCWTAKWRGKNEKFHFGAKWEKGGSEKMLTRIHALLEQADAVVTYNGDHFDRPTLNAEFLKLGLTPPPPSKQIDLLKTVKREFRLVSNKLDFVARHLGLKGKVQHKGMELWFGCMSGKKADQNIMKIYNIHDVRLLENVYDKVLPWIRSQLNYGQFVDANVEVCTNCGSDDLERRGFARTSTQSYQRYQCTACGKWLRGRLTTLEKEDKEHLLVGIG